MVIDSLANSLQVVDPREFGTPEPIVVPHIGHVSQQSSVLRSVTSPVELFY